MAENKKHHYVPRFLLRRFSSNGKSIGIYNIASKKKIPNGNLYNQCYTNYLYGKDNELEKALGEVEGALALLLRAMDEAIGPPPPFSEAHKLMLLFVLSQRGRTQYAADAADELIDKMVKALYGNMFKNEHGVDLSKVKVSLTEAARESLSLTLSMFPLLLDMDSKMLVNSTAEEFVISDNPVVFYNQLMSFQQFGSNCGAACKGLQILVPIDSRKTLVLFDPAVYRVGKESSDIVQITNPQDVYELNALQFVAALQNIYFRSPGFEVEPLHKKASPFLRSHKTNLKEFPTKSEDGREGSFLATSSEDVRTNLYLSFVTLRGAAKAWRADFRKQRSRPAAVVRSKELVEEHERFMEEVKKGTYTVFEFDKHMDATMKAEKAAEPPAN